MSNYSWREYKSLNLENNLKSAKFPLDQCLSFTNNKSFQVENALLHVLKTKIKLRLRNYKFSRLLQQVDSKIQLFLKEVPLLTAKKSFVIVVLSNLKENFNTATGRILLPWQEDVKELMLNIYSLSKTSFEIAQYALFAYGQCTPWLRLGHLTPHFLVAIAVLSRIRINFKYVLVKLNEFYKALNDLRLKLRTKSNLNSPDLSSTDIEKFCKDLFNLEQASGSQTIINSSNDLGTPVPRVPEEEISETSSSESEISETPRKQAKVELKVFSAPKPTISQRKKKKLQTNAKAKSNKRERRQQKRFIKKLSCTL